MKGYGVRLHKAAGILALSLMALVSGCTSKQNQAIPEISGMKLAWHDEFDYQGLPNPEKWGYDTGGGGWGNDELQYYTENRLDNAKVEKGMLILTARKESLEGSDYTSARLVTKDKGDWLYGHVEVRAKIPGGRGSWPAIWMMPSESAYGNWPNSGEMDIMEHVGFDKGIIHATAHTEKYYWKNNNQKTGQIAVDSPDDGFHIYALDWRADEIKASVDGKTYFTYKRDESELDEGSAVWPFDRKFYLILNIAIGGSWGGQQGVDDEAFPQPMEVDYVRVYQKK